MWIKKIAVCFMFLALSCGGCDDDVGAGSNNGGANNGTANNGGVDGGGGIDGGANTDASNNNGSDVFETNTNGQVLCKGGEPCQCDNGIDDDGDGLIDGFDPECTGPYDDDESSFATGISGDNKDPKWQDCFFDGNSGSGDDSCRYHTECITGEKTADDPDCQVSQACFDFCRPRTPNGCDCFGCCEVFDDANNSQFVLLEETCSISNLSACTTCTQTTECTNSCGRCELCFGKTIDDLPADCGTPVGGGDMGPDGGNGGGPDGGGGGPGNTCDDGEPVCTTDSGCPENNQYCFQGCCTIVFN